MVTDQSNAQQVPQHSGIPGKWQTMALEILQKLFDERYTNLEDGGFDPCTARVSVSEWRDAVFVGAGMDNRATWRRIKETLSEQNKIGILSGFVTLI